MGNTITENITNAVTTTTDIESVLLGDRITALVL